MGFVKSLDEVVGSEQLSQRSFITALYGPGWKPAVLVLPNIPFGMLGFLGSRLFRFARSGAVQLIIFSGIGMRAYAVLEI